MELKSEIKGFKIVLKHLVPTISLAQELTDIIARNKEHLTPFEDVRLTEFQSVEESFKTLLSYEKEFTNSRRFSYGLYKESKLIGIIEIKGMRESIKQGMLSFFVDHEHTRQGYATESIQLVEREFFGNIEWNRLIWVAISNNNASCQLAQKLGYTKEGLLRDAYVNHGQYVDFSYFSKLKSEWESQNKLKA